MDYIGGMARSMNPAEWLLLLIVACLWGGSFFFFRILAPVLPPLTVVFLRVGIAALLLHGWLAARGQVVRVSPRLWLELAVLAVMNNVVPFLLLAWAEARVGTGVGAIANATTPVFSMLVAHVFLRDDRMTRGRAAGVGLGLAGVAVLIGPDAWRGAHPGAVAGEIAGVAAAICYGFAGPYTRRFRALTPVQIATVQLTCSTLILLPAWLAIEPPWAMARPAWTTCAALLGLAVLSTAVAFLLYFRLVATAGAVNASLVTLLVPVTALGLGWAALGEGVAPTALLGLGLIALAFAAVDGRLLPTARRLVRGEAR